ncbi:MAG: NUDIX domain-containing protein [Clostridia bacterium]|nr:NUDIX domain-containing protein [Clostridia bacterium]
MKKLNLIVVFNHDMTQGLFCIRAKEPYKGLYNFVGGKIEPGETNEEAAYRELFEETGISNKDIELDYFMDLNYFKYGNSLQVFYGILKHEVVLIEEKNKLEWITLNDELLNLEKFAGNYNIPHIVKQIQVYLRENK